MIIFFIITILFTGCGPSEEMCMFAIKKAGKVYLYNSASFIQDDIKSVASSFYLRFGGICKI